MPIVIPKIAGSVSEEQFALSLYGDSDAFRALANLLGQFPSPTTLELRGEEELAKSETPIQQVRLVIADGFIEARRSADGAEIAGSRESFARFRASVDLLARDYEEKGIERYEDCCYYPEHPFLSPGTMGIVLYLRARTPK